MSAAPRNARSDAGAAKGRRGGRRRGRWLRRLWLPGALAALLVGIGSQWIGGGSGAPADGDGEPARQDRDAQTPSSQTPPNRTPPVDVPSAKAAGAQQPAPSDPAGGRSDGRDPAGREPAGSGGGAKARREPATTSSGRTLPTAEPAAPAAGVRSSAPGNEPPPRSPEPGPESAPTLTTFEPDRFESLLSLVRSRAAQGEFAAARRHLAVLQREPLVAPQAAAVNTVAEELRGAVHERVTAILRTAAEGAVVRAGRRATAGLDDGSKEFARELREAFAAAGLGRDPTATPAVPARSWPAPSPIPAERRLRFFRGAEELVGTVVECDDRRVTLRVAADGRVRFPTVARTASEAVESTRAEAAEFALAALHAGQPLLARLWLHRARAAGAGAASAREQRLVELLR